MRGERARIFVSYQHGDSGHVAMDLRDQLSADYEVLVDTRIVDGDKWRSRLRLWMQVCDGAVLLISPEYLESSYCIWEAQLLANRADTADDNGKAFHLLPYLMPGVTAADVATSERLAPASLHERQLAPFPTIEQLRARLAAVARGNDRDTHRLHLMPLLPASDRAAVLVANYFPDVNLAGSDPRVCLADALLSASASIEANGPADPLSLLSHPLNRLGGDLAPTAYHNLLFSVGAARVPVPDAEALDHVGPAAPAFAVPAPTPHVATALLRLMLSCASFARWGGVELTSLERLHLARVLVDTPPNNQHSDVVASVAQQIASHLDPSVSNQVGGDCCTVW